MVSHEAWYGPGHATGAAAAVKMSFGKFKNHEIADLPDAYLAWVLTQNWIREPVRSALERERYARHGVDAGGPAVFIAPQVAASAEAIITAGYRALAKQHHPDRGGDVEAMARVNAAVGALRALLRKHAGAA